MSNMPPLPDDNDASNGWQQIAPQFIQHRQHSRIGVEVVTKWAQQLPASCDVLDLGCGFGVPLSEVLLNQGLNVYGIDAAPGLIAEFKRKFPDSPARCEAVECSDFYGKTFAGVIAIGLMFLLPKHNQLLLIEKVAKSLKQDGRFLFSAPYQICSWQDVLTGRKSISLGRDRYLAALQEHGLTLIAEFADEGQNHYFAALKR